MIIVKPPIQQDNKVARMRRAAERLGIVFNDLTLEAEVNASRAALEALDLCGHIAHDALARHVAVIISVTEYEDHDAGHQWLHSWLEANNLEGTCTSSLAAAVDFGNFVLSSDTVTEALDAFRLAASHKFDLPKKIDGIGDAMLEGLEVDETLLESVLDGFYNLFSEYATPENRLGDVANVCHGIRGIIPQQAMATYLTNGIVAVNWGLVGGEFTARMFAEEILGKHVDIRAVSLENFQGVPRGHAAPPSSSGDEGLDDLKKLFGFGQDEDDE